MDSIDGDPRWHNDDDDNSAGVTRDRADVDLYLYRVYPYKAIKELVLLETRWQ